MFTPSRNRKKSALKEYIANTPDPDRGYALAAITGDFKVKNITASFYHELIKDQVDYEFFKMSYDYVGDLAETISLIWPIKSVKIQEELSRIASVMSDRRPMIFYWLNDKLLSEMRRSSRLFPVLRDPSLATPSMISRDARGSRAL